MTKTAHFSVIGAVLCSPFLGFAQTPPATSVENPDFVVYQRKIDSARSPDNLFTAVGGGISKVVTDPVIGPALIVAAAAYGVPPEVVGGIGGIAAGVSSEQSKAKRQVPRNGYHSYSMGPPDGFAFCAVQLKAVSIHPTKRNRPKAALSVSKSGLTFTVDHSSQAFGQGRSRVKVDFAILAVKNDKLASYPEKCRFTEAATTVIGLCRGSDCAPLMQGQWYTGAKTS